MKIINTLDFPPAGERTVLTIGKFDGLHKGHMTLIGRTVEEVRSMRAAGSSCLAAVCTMDASSAMILSGEERREALTEAGVDLLIALRLDAGVIGMAAEDFIAEVLVRRLRICRILIGADFRFGYRRQGDEEMLRRFGKSCGFEVEVIPLVCLGGEKISSSKIRDLLLSGKMEEAQEMLGYPFGVSGRVVHGRALGRTIGFPTANLIPAPDKLLPPRGVYFSEADIGGRTVRGITNVGTKPTVDGGYVGVETSFFGFDEDLYEDELHVRLLHFHRAERRFDSVRALTAQIRQDREAALSWFGSR